MELEDLYERSLWKWEDILREAEVLDFKDIHIVAAFSSRLFRPCSFCYDAWEEGQFPVANCRINKHICNCNKGHSTALLGVFRPSMDKEKVVKWVKWIVASLRQELRLLK